MRVAVVDWDVAYPMNSGKRLRTLGLLLSLAQRHEITYLSRASGGTAEAQAAAEYLQSVGIQTVFADMPVPKKRGVGFAARLLRSLASPHPYAVDVHLRGGFGRFLRRFAEQHHFDVWQLEWTPYVEMLRGLPGVRKLLVAHNVDSLIWRRYAESETRPLRRALVRQQHERFHRFEQRAFRHADRVVTVSDEDAALAHDLFGVEHVDVVENGVDVAAFGRTPRRPDPHEFLFLGSLDWRPNLDAVRQLLNEVLPRVCEEEPRARLQIVGRNPPDWLLQAATQQPNVSVHANVPDVKPYLATCGAMLVPLRIGGGSRLKILEALAAKVPVIASKVAAEGLRLEPGVDYAVADDAGAMAKQAVRWARSPADAAASAEAGQRAVAAAYDWGSLAEKLEASWRRCAGGDRD